MNTLAVLLSQVVTVLQESGYCVPCTSWKLTHSLGRQFALKVRAELITIRVDGAEVTLGSKP